ncbi:MAG: hypothetical protein H6722_32355, partial [Sandaracinus sp.]|nr:hypothetical protein [Sandaracinus sp.]
MSTGRRLGRELASLGVRSVGRCGRTAGRVSALLAASRRLAQRCRVRPPTTYWDYIRVEEMLGLQGGLEPDDAGLSNDEVLFITVHQIDELWFKLVLRELVAVRNLFAQPHVPEQALA